MPVYQAEDIHETRTFHVIASDGGFLERPVPLNIIRLSAGERAGILVDFSKESRYVVISLLVDQIKGSRFYDYTGVYMYHCHLLEYEDDGMMGQFEVIT
ncbi:multicopper oxidase domain-containing protein [Desulfobacula sp.]